MTLMHYINGAEKAGASGRAQDVFNPATGQPVTSVPLASTDEVNAAVAAASVRKSGNLGIWEPENVESKKSNDSSARP